MSVQLNFDASQVNPNAEGGGLPLWPHDVIVPVQIVESEPKGTRTGNNSGKLELVLVAGPNNVGVQEGSRQILNLNLWNQNATSVEIAQQELSALIYVTTGVMQNKYQIGNSAELHNIPFLIRSQNRPVTSTDPKSKEVKTTIYQDWGGFYAYQTGLGPKGEKAYPDGQTQGGSQPQGGGAPFQGAGGSAPQMGAPAQAPGGFVPAQNPGAFQPNGGTATSGFSPQQPQQQQPQQPAQGFAPQQQQQPAQQQQPGFQGNQPGFVPQQQQPQGGFVPQGGGQPQQQQPQGGFAPQQQQQQPQQQPQQQQGNFGGPQGQGGGAVPWGQRPQ